MPKVKNYFSVNIYFIYPYSKLKDRVTRRFVLSTYSDNSYRHFAPEVRSKVLLLKLI